MTTATAPGKVILVGEHAVVYGRPAIAAPVWETVAVATITDLPSGSGCTLCAHDLGQQLRLALVPDDAPLALVARLTLERLGLPDDPDWQIDLRSDIPIASGLGSGAAMSAALVRAIMMHTGRPSEASVVSELVFESERLYHGTPSGIDNTVIAYGVPVWFVKGQSPELLLPRRAFTLAIADSGVASPTKEAVAEVRHQWNATPERYEAWFDEIGGIAIAARQALEQGAIEALGPLLDHNQELLAKIGVNSPSLETLIQAARRAGATGAKLSGSGKGGNIIALVDESTAARVQDALLAAGAQRVILTTVQGIFGHGGGVA